MTWQNGPNYCRAFATKRHHLRSWPLIKDTIWSVLTLSTICLLIILLGPVWYIGPNEMEVIYTDCFVQQNYVMRPPNSIALTNQKRYSAADLIKSDVLWNFVYVFLRIILLGLVACTEINVYLQIPDLLIKWQYRYTFTNRLVDWYLER